MNKIVWKKPAIETLGSAQDLIMELGNNKEPGPTDFALAGVAIRTVS
tara:strand:+ start:250 stop:390 length:141 start_codon:yes stop_codon:yes gene_type:complete